MLVRNINYLNYFENDLFEIKNIIKLTLKNRDTHTENLLNNLSATDGKMIRAIFILIGRSFGKIDKNKLFNISAEIELLHLATLVHDDVIDDSNLRRGKKLLIVYIEQKHPYSWEIIFLRKLIFYFLNMLLEILFHIFPKQLSSYAKVKLINFYLHTL